MGGDSYSRRKALKRWVELGGAVANIRGTGEIRLTHPSFASSITLNGRRKDVTRVVVNRLRQLSEGVP